MVFAEVRTPAQLCSRTIMHGVPKTPLFSPAADVATNGVTIENKRPKLVFSSEWKQSLTPTRETTLQLVQVIKR